MVRSSQTSRRPVDRAALIFLKETKPIGVPNFRDKVGCETKKGKKPSPCEFQAVFWNEIMSVGDQLMYIHLNEIHGEKRRTAQDSTKQAMRTNMYYMLHFSAITKT